MAPGRSSELSSSQSKDRSLSQPKLSLAHTGPDRPHAANSRGVLPSAPQNQNEGSQSSYEDNSTEIEGPDPRAPTHSAHAKDTTPSILKPLRDPSGLAAPTHGSRFLAGLGSRPHQQRRSRLPSILCHPNLSNQSSLRRKRKMKEF